MHVAHEPSLIHKYSRVFTLKRKHDTTAAYIARGDKKPRHYTEICTSVSRPGRFKSLVRAPLPLGGTDVEEKRQHLPRIEAPPPSKHLVTLLITLPRTAYRHINKLGNTE